MMIANMPRIKGKQVEITTNVVLTIKEAGEGVHTLGMELIPVEYADGTYDIVSYTPRDGKLASLARSRQHGRPEANPHVLRGLMNAHSMPRIVVDSLHHKLVGTFDSLHGTAFLTIHIGRGATEAKKDLISYS